MFAHQTWETKNVPVFYNAHTCAASVGQALISVATEGDCAMEAIISTAETGFNGSLVGSSIPYTHTQAEKEGERKRERQRERARRRGRKRGRERKKER